MQLLPLMLLAGTRWTWVSPLVPAVRLFLWIIWPIHAVLDLAVSVLRISEDEPSAPVTEQQAIEALVDAATEEGIIEQDEARLIEQVVEFGDKRVRDVMTPRPDVVAISAKATLEELRKRVVATQILAAAGVRKNAGRHCGHRDGARHAGSSRPRRGAPYRARADAAGAICPGDEIWLRAVEGNAAQEPADGHRD